VILTRRLKANADARDEVENEEVDDDDDRALISTGTSAACREARHNAVNKKTPMKYTAGMVLGDGEKNFSGRC
jgi:hypothetical protein